jgi:hypothetical protein
MTYAQIASKRIGTLSKHGVNNRAMEELSHELKLWEEHTGKKLTGKHEGYEMTAPKGTSFMERHLLNDIIYTFLTDPTTTLKGIKETYKNLPNNVNKRIRKRSVGEQAYAIDIAERMRKEQVVKNTVGSKQYHYMWNIYKDNYKDDYDYKDYLEAMYAVTTGEVSYGIEALVLGEGIDYTSISTEDDFEDATIDYLLRVMEARR